MYENTSQLRAQYLISHHTNSGQSLDTPRSMYNFYVFETQ